MSADDGADIALEMKAQEMAEKALPASIPEAVRKAKLPAVKEKILKQLRAKAAAKAPGGGPPPPTGVAPPSAQPPPPGQPPPPSQPPPSTSTGSSQPPPPPGQPPPPSSPAQSFASPAYPAVEAKPPPEEEEKEYELNAEEGIEIFADQKWFSNDKIRQPLRDHIASMHKEQKILVGTPHEEIPRVYPSDGRILGAGGILRLGGAHIGGYGESDIAYAYRHLSRVLHPDKVKDIADGANAFKRLSEAADELREGLTQSRIMIQKLASVLGGNITEEMTARPQETLFATATKFLAAILHVTTEGEVEGGERVRAAVAFAKSWAFPGCPSHVLAQRWTSTPDCLELFGSKCLRTAYDCSKKPYRAQFLCFLSRCACLECPLSQNEAASDKLRVQWSKIFELYPEVVIWREWLDQIRPKLFEDPNKTKSRSRGRKRSESDEEFLNNLQPGAVVRIHGLQAAAHLNGETGTLDTFNLVNRRWRIKLDSGEFKEVRQKNIELVVTEEQQAEAAEPQNELDMGALDYIQQMAKEHAKEQAKIAREEEREAERQAREARRLDIHGAAAMAAKSLALKQGLEATVVDWRDVHGYGFLQMHDGRRCYIHHKIFGHGDLKIGQKLIVKIAQDPRDPSKWMASEVLDGLQVHGDLISGGMNRRKGKGKGKDKGKDKGKGKGKERERERSPPRESAAERKAKEEAEAKRKRLADIKPTKWAKKWRYCLRDVLPGAEEGPAPFTDPEVRKMCIALWEELVAMSPEGPAKAALRLFEADPVKKDTKDTTDPAPDPAPEVEGEEKKEQPPEVKQPKWAYVPAADILLLIGEGLVALTIDGAYTTKPGERRYKFEEVNPSKPEESRTVEGGKKTRPLETSSFDPEAPPGDENEEQGEKGGPDGEGKWSHDRYNRSRSREGRRRSRSGSRRRRSRSGGWRRRSRSWKRHDDRRRSRSKSRRRRSRSGGRDGGRDSWRKRSRSWGKDVRDDRGGKDVRDDRRRSRSGRRRSRSKRRRSPPPQGDIPPWRPEVEVKTGQGGMDAADLEFHVGQRRKYTLTFVDGTETKPGTFGSIGWFKKYGGKSANEALDVAPDDMYGIHDAGLDTYFVSKAEAIKEIKEA